MAFSKSMAYYQQACLEHREFLIYGQKFEETMTMVLEFHCEGGGTGSPCVLPFDVLMRASSYVTESIEESAKEIVRHKQEVGGDIQLLRMVRNYFKLCRTTVDSLRKLRVSLGACVMELEAIVRRNGPVTDEIRCVEGAANRSFLSLTHLIRNHVAMLTTLQEARGKDLPVGAATRSRQVATVLLVTVFSSAVICSILAAVFHFPPALAALPAAFIAITSWNPFIQWLDGLWVKVEEGWRGRGKKASSSTQELEEIKLLMDNISTVSLPDRFSRMVAGDRGRAPLPGDLRRGMAELDKQMEKCCSDIHKAKLDLHEKITRPRRRRDRARVLVYKQADVLEEKMEKLLKKTSEMFERLGINRRS